MKAVSGTMLILLLTGMLTLTFNILLVEASGSIYIRADGSVDPAIAPIQRDGDVYTFTDNIYASIVVERDNVVVDGVGYLVQGTGDGEGIELSGRSNLTIKNMEIKAFNTGIGFDDSSNSTVSGNDITANNWWGISLSGSDYNNIYGNNITNNDYGIGLSYSSHNNVSGNNIEANNAHGIEFRTSSDYNNIYGNNITNNEDGILLFKFLRIYSPSSDYNNIYGNNITNNEYGIRLEGSSGNIIYGNNIEANNWCGISLAKSSYHDPLCRTFSTPSDYNNIYGNNITNNRSGIFLEDSSNNIISNNIIYHNNFMDIQPGYANLWDNGYPSGGNYWSDYTDVDMFSGPDQNATGSDGIGDTPYTIDANNTDRYPLMGPFSFFNAGTWDEITYYVHTVSNSTVSDFYFSTDNKLVSFNVTGPDDTVGFCRGTIPKRLLWCDDPSQWIVLVDDQQISPKVMEDENLTYLYFLYNQSTHQVQIIGTQTGVTIKATTPSLWVQWWFWAIIAAGIVVLAGAVYFLKKRKPPTPTAPPLPPEGALQNINLLTFTIAIYKRRTLETPIQ